MPNNKVLKKKKKTRKKNLKGKQSMSFTVVFPVFYLQQCFVGLQCTRVFFIFISITLMFLKANKLLLSILCSALKMNFKM